MSHKGRFNKVVNPFVYTMLLNSLKLILSLIRKVTFINDFLVLQGCCYIQSGSKSGSQPTAINNCVEIPN